MSKIIMKCFAIAQLIVHEKCEDFHRRFQFWNFNIVGKFREGSNFDLNHYICSFVDLMAVEPLRQKECILFNNLSQLLFNVKVNLEDLLTFWPSQQNDRWENHNICPQ